MMDRRKKELYAGFAMMITVAVLYGICFGRITIYAEELYGEYAGENREDVIYVAGSPEEWPWEYADKAEGQYMGVLPDVLQEISEKTGLQFEYINDDGKPDKFSMVKNIQVDMVWTIGMTRDEIIQAGLEPGTSFCVQKEDGALMEIVTAYTESMREDYKMSIESSVEELNPSYIVGRVAVHAQKGQKYHDFEQIRILLATLGLLLVIFVMLTFAFGLKSRRNRIKLRDVVYVDEVTGGDSFEGWKQKYESVVKDENCESYAVLYINPGIDSVSRILEYEDNKQLLALVTKAIDAGIRDKSECYARINDQHYVVLLKYVGDESMKERIEGIIAGIEDLFQNEKKLSLKIHVGMFFIRRKDKMPGKAIHYAEIAMRYAKNNLLPYASYSDKVEKKVLAERVLEKEIEQGLRNKEFEIYLQPFVHMGTGEICGAEALVRWSHPVRGLLAPDQFIPLMQKKKKIAQLNLEIFRQGCVLLEKEKQKEHELMMMFNFSADNLSDSGFAEYLIELVDRYHIACRQIIIQINEMVAAGNLKSHEQTLRKLKELGFHLCISGLELDNGFMEYIQAGVDSVKLRYQLLRHMENPKGKKVIQEIVYLCKVLHMDTYCVGVENEAQVNELTAVGCDIVSGFYYYYPMDASLFDEIISQKK